MDLSDYEPELIVDELYPLPDPLDHNIASVAVWTDANDPTDGYDILLTSNVGSDLISLTVDGWSIEVSLEIYQAEIAMRFANRRVGFGPDHTQLFGHSGRILDRSINEETAKSLTGRIAAQGSIEASASSKRIEQQRTSAPDIAFDHHAINSLRFGSWRKKNVLDGQYIPAYRGWRAKNRAKNEPSGVLAALRVRKNWINFADVNAQQHKGIAARLKALLHSQNEGDKLKAALFPELLKELTLLGLQNEGDSSIATLAVAGFIVRPGEEGTVIGQVSEHDKRKVEISGSLLLGFLNSPNDSVKAAYNSAIRAARQRLVGSDFTPLSGYLDALKAYLELAIQYRETRGAFQVDNLIQRFGDPVVTDLRKLGAVTSDRKNTAYFTSLHSNADPVYAFQALVRSQETIKLTEKLLLENPDATNYEIGEMLRTALGRTWGQASTKRYGNQIKNWARQQQTEGRGRPSIISDMKEPVVLRLHADGKTAQEIADLIGSAPETVRRYFRERNDKTE